MKAIENFFDGIRPQFEGDGRLARFWPMLELVETFFLTPAEATHRGAHVRDRMDLKRMMIFVNFALTPAVLFACWNIGYQAYLAEGAAEVNHVANVVRGLWHFLPVYAVTVAVGGAWEALFAVVRKHEINEGFLVSSLLFPLTLPPTIPLWMVAMGISFGIVIGKEVFGGVGFNILNPALTARAFVFFAYPAAISGAKTAEGFGVWSAGGQMNPMGGFAAADSAMLVDGYSGATPLLAVANASDMTAMQALEAEGWQWADLFFGFIPGSMGEYSTLAILIGAVFLVVTRVASWRIMVGSVAGMFAMTSVFFFLFAGNPEMNPMFTLPPWYHLVMGGFAFGTVFMATDPVSAAVTPTARLIYGFFIGVVCALIRVVNPAYPEGMMLAILLLNVFAPLIDYYVVRASTRKRVARLATA